MKRNPKILITRPIIGLGAICLALLCVLSMPVQAQEAAGRVQFVVGDVSSQSADGKMRQLKKGDRIYPGDTIKTGDEGSAQLIYRDRSRMAVRVNTEFKIKEYRYDEKDSKGSTSLFSLLGGALRTVSGLIGSLSPQSVTVDTPIATIGIRGTDHEVVHIVQQPDGGKPIADIGTYNKVYAGATIIRTDRGNLNLELNQVGFVPGTRGNVLKPVRINDLPAAIKNQLINKIPVQARTLPNVNETATTTGSDAAATGKAATGDNRVIPGLSTKGSGSQGVAAPDVVKTPSPGGPIPVPYPNVGISGEAIGGKLAPTTTLPATTLPRATLPSTTVVPNVSIPTTYAPKISVPTTTVLPKVTVPTTTVPKLTVPTTTVVPKVTVPTTTTVPTVTVPSTTLPKATIPSTTTTLPRTIQK